VWHRDFFFHREMANTRLSRPVKWTLGPWSSIHRRLAANGPRWNGNWTGPINRPPTHRWKLLSPPPPARSNGGAATSSSSAAGNEGFMPKGRPHKCSCSAATDCGPGLKEEARFYASVSAPSSDAFSSLHGF